MLDLLSIQFRSVAQSCQTLCDPMNHNTPGLDVCNRNFHFKNITHRQLCIRQCWQTFIFHKYFFFYWTKRMSSFFKKTENTWFKMLCQFLVISKWLSFIYIYIYIYIHIHTYIHTHTYIYSFSYSSKMFSFLKCTKIQWNWYRYWEIYW